MASANAAGLDVIGHHLSRNNTHIALPLFLCLTPVFTCSDIHMHCVTLHHVSIQLLQRSVQCDRLKDQLRYVTPDSLQNAMSGTEQFVVIGDSLIGKRFSSPCPKGSDFLIPEGSYNQVMDCDSDSAASFWDIIAFHAFVSKSILCAYTMSC